ILTSQFEVVCLEVHQEFDATTMHFPDPELGWNRTRNGSPANLLFDEEQWEQRLHIQRAFATVVLLHDWQVPSHEFCKQPVEASVSLCTSGIQYEVVAARIVAGTTGQFWTTDHAYESTITLRNHVT